MFCGIIEGRCKVVNVKHLNRGVRCYFEFDKTFEIYGGQSISIDGACLTVEDFEDNRAGFFISDETLRITKFGNVLETGYICNYERSLKVGESIDGHFVLGHVDGVGKILKIYDYGSSGRELLIAFPLDLSPYISRKGSIAIDGISLTVNSVERNTIKVRIIPKTLEITALKYRKEGDLVNMEVDVLAKYVVSYLMNRHDKG